MPGNREDACVTRAGKWSTCERGDSSAKWLFWGAVLGAGAGADVRAAQRGGDPPRAPAQAVEAPRDDRGEAGRARPAVRRRQGVAARPGRGGLGRRGAVRVAGCPVGPGAPAAPSAREELERRLAEARARRRRSRETSRSRSPERRPTRRVASLTRRLHPPHPAGRRRIQHPLPRERAHLRRAAGGHSVRAAAADRPDPPGAGTAGQHPGGRADRCSTASSRRTSLRRVATRSARSRRCWSGSPRTGARSRSTPCRRSSGSAPGSSPGSALR